jgi:hypothetical protein
MTSVARRIAALAAVAVAACADGTAPQRSITFTGRWASRPWEGAASALLRPGGADGDTLYVFGRVPADPNAIPTQSIRLRVVPFRGAGSYPLGPENAELTDILGGDVATSWYIGRAPVAGTLDVVGYDGVGREIAGAVSFQAVPVRSSNAPYGPTASFENGHFRAVLETVAPR